MERRRRWGKEGIWFSHLTREFPICAKAQLFDVGGEINSMMKMMLMSMTKERERTIGLNCNEPFQARIYVCVICRLFIIRPNFARTYHHVHTYFGQVYFPISASDLLSCLAIDDFGHDDNDDVDHHHQVLSRGGGGLSAMDYYNIIL